MEGQMRAVVSTLGIAAFIAVSAQAAPIAVPAKVSTVERRARPAIELAREGCGWGWHRGHWRDRGGYWHWGRCFLNW
jgi:hypothetical protein